jgi:hypothetical protein
LTDSLLLNCLRRQLADFAPIPLPGCGNATERFGIGSSPDALFVADHLEVHLAIGCDDELVIRTAVIGAASDHVPIGSLKNLDFQSGCLLSPNNQLSCRLTRGETWRHEEPLVAWPGVATH